MRSDPKITFLIPFYGNSSQQLRFLKDTINSVLKQTRDDWRIIVADDASPVQGVNELIDSFQDSRIQLKRNEKNLLSAGNWNRWVPSIETEFYSILHADDELEPEYTEEMIEFLSKNSEVDAVFCDAITIDSAGKKMFSLIDLVKKFIAPKGQYELIGQDGVLKLLNGNFIFCPSVCYRASSMKQHKYDPTGRFKYMPDYEYWFRVLFAGARLAKLNKTLFRYRRHQQNTSQEGIKALAWFDEELNLRAWVKQEAALRNWSLVVKAASSSSIVLLRLLYDLAWDLISLRLKAAQKKAKFFITVWFK
jgi:glycosyltransferase involved in cell wall biosynthesis